jgi:hypothetical protein
VIEQRKDKIHLVDLSVGEFAQAYELLPVSPLNEGYAGEAQIRPRYGLGPEWYGGLKKTSDAKKLLTDGWVEGAERIMKFRSELASLVPAPRSRRRVPRWDDDGHTVDVDRALAGRWDAAYRTARRETVLGPQMVELLGTFGGNCSVSAEEMFWNGATALILTDILEEAGYSVRLVSASYTNGGGGLTTTRIELKDSGEPLRIDALASIVCHAGVYRTFGFAAILHSPFDVGCGLGSHVKAPEGNRQLGSLHNSEAICLADTSDKEDAVDEIKRVLKLITGGDSDEK